MRLFHRVAAVLALAACDESPDAWRARMAAELDRSLALYARPRDADEAEQLVRRLLGDPYRSVLVLRNRLIFDRRLFSRAKVMHHVEFVRSVMEAGPSDNFAYQFEWNANGANSEDQLVREGCPTPAAMPRRRVKPKSWAAQPRQSPIPRVVIAKRYGYEQCGVMMPNCYFDDVTKWGRVAAATARAANATPLADRDPRLFWRGAIRTRDDCEDEFGNFARAEAVALTARDPASFDVRCLQCDVRDGAANPCDRPVFSAATRRDVLSLGRAAHANRSVYGAYQFQLNLPGSVSGSYSRNLNHLWLLGSAVALWDAPYVEWYYPALTAGVTHLAVDAGTARAALDAARRDPAALARLAANARRVHDELLCPACLGAYWRALVAKMRAYFSLGLVLDDPARLRRVLEALGAGGARLVQLAVGGFAGGRTLNASTSTVSLRYVVDFPAFVDDVAPRPAPPPPPRGPRPAPEAKAKPPPPKKKKKPRKRRGHQYSAKRKQANFKLKLDAVRNKRDDDDGAWGGELEALLEQHGDQGGL